MVFRGQSEGKSIFAAFGWGKFWGEQQAAVALVAAACILAFDLSLRVVLDTANLRNASSGRILRISGVRKRNSRAGTPKTLANSSSSRRLRKRDHATGRRRAHSPDACNGFSPHRCQPRRATASSSWHTRGDSPSLHSRNQCQCKPRNYSTADPWHDSFAVTVCNTYGNAQRQSDGHSRHQSLRNSPHLRQTPKEA